MHAMTSCVACYVAAWQLRIHNLLACEWCRCSSLALQACCTVGQSPIPAVPVWQELTHRFRMLASLTALLQRIGSL